MPVGDHSSTAGEVVCPGFNSFNSLERGYNSLVAYSQQSRICIHTHAYHTHALLSPQIKSTQLTSTLKHVHTHLQVAGSGRALAYGLHSLQLTPLLQEVAQDFAKYPEVMIAVERVYGAVVGNCQVHVVIYMYLFKTYAGCITTSLIYQDMLYHSWD